MATTKSGNRVSNQILMDVGYAATGVTIAAGDFLKITAGYLEPIAATAGGIQAVYGRALSNITTGTGTAVDANKVDFLPVVGTVSVFDVQYVTATPVVGILYDLGAANAGIPTNNTTTHPVFRVTKIVDTTAKIARGVIDK